MAKAIGVIEIDGANYDVASGRTLGKAKRVASQLKRPSVDQVIDGFIKSKASERAPKSAKMADTKPAKTRKSRRAVPAAHAVHQRREHSRTLMRTRLSRPAIKLKDATSNLATATITTKTNVARERLARAKSITKHTQVARFGSPKLQAKDSATKAAEPEVIVAQNVRPVATVATKPLPSMIASASHQKLERMLDEALVRANAHKQTKRSSRVGKLPRWLAIAMAVVVLAIVALFLAWRNIPAVAVKFAGTKAGLPAVVPAYTPAGYSFTTAASTPHAVTIKYKAADQSTYSVIQQKSTTDAAGLVKNAQINNKNIQTSQINGVQVILDNNSATCVNGGIQTTVASQDSSLDPSQLLSIAKGVCDN